MTERAWQPIETAPKDGTCILVAYPLFNRENNTNKPDAYETVIVRWNGVGWDTRAWVLHREPAAWQPLPEYRAPAEQSLSEKDDRR